MTTGVPLSPCSFATLTPDKAGEWPFSLAEGDGLALAAAESASHPCLAQGPLELNAGIWFLQRHSFRFPQHWRDYLGTHVADQIEQSRFCLALRQQSQPKDVSKLAHRLDRLYFCTQLHGLPGLGDFWIVPARCTGSQLEPHGLWSGNHKALPDIEGFATTLDTLTGAANMLPNAEVALDTPGVYGRVQRGKHALSRAMSEPWPDFRLHHYVQALEAVIMPGSGKRTGSDFRERTALFTAPSSEAESAIEDIYELRCNTEHLHGWMAPRDHKSRRWEIDEHQAQLRLWQVENLAFHVYRRILSRRHVLDHFHDNEAIEQFWALDEQTRRNEWGEPLDLARFVWKASSHLGVRDYSPLASFPGGVRSGERGDVPPWPRDAESRADGGTA